MYVPLVTIVPYCPVQKEADESNGGGKNAEGKIAGNAEKAEDTGEGSYWEQFDMEGGGIG